MEQGLVTIVTRRGKTDENQYHICHGSVLSIPLIYGQNRVIFSSFLRYVRQTISPVKSLFIVLVCLYSLPLAAQKKVDLDPYSFTVQWRSLPTRKIDSTYRTYNVEVETSRLMQNFLSELTPEETVLLEGWKKLPAGGHISIKVNLEDLLPEAVSVRERSEAVKDRAGQVTGTRTFYREEVRYSFSARAVITDYRGAHILDLNLASRGDKYTYNSPEFALKPLAQGYFMLNSARITGELFRSCVNKSMHRLSETITENFGFSKVSSRDQMWIVDSRKHPEYDAHREAFRTITDVLFSMNADSSIDKARERLKPVIAYFEKLKEEYSSSSKHDRKMRYASYYNLAVLYYYLDDPQNMMKEAQGLILNDYDVSDGKAFERTAIWLKNLFETNNIYTRHFPVDPSSFKGPFEKEAVSVK